PQLRQLLADKTSVPNDPNVMSRQPFREFVVPAVVNAVGLQGGESPGSVHGHHRHIGILPKRSRIFGKRKEPLHDYAIRLQFAFKIKKGGTLR
ncbi:MAG: hypothetical protein LC642_04560, partial [Verrucomicrobiaceae bacterium]|nr:hypothetical protein [Verrucomicrobiaceae bacterium]